MQHLICHFLAAYIGQLARWWVFALLNSLKFFEDPFRYPFVLLPPRAGNVSEPARCLTNVSQVGGRKKKQGRESASHWRRGAKKNDLS